MENEIKIDNPRLDADGLPKKRIKQDDFSSLVEVYYDALDHLESMEGHVRGLQYELKRSRKFIVLMTGLFMLITFFNLFLLAKRL